MDAEAMVDAFKKISRALISFSVFVFALIILTPRALFDVGSKVISFTISSVISVRFPVFSASRRVDELLLK